MVSITPTLVGIQSASLGGLTNNRLTEISANHIQNFKPTTVEDGRIVGQAMVHQLGGVGAQPVTVLAVALKGGQGRYYLVPPNATPTQIFSLVSKQHPKLG